MLANRGKAVFCLCTLSSLLLLSHFLRQAAPERIHFESLKEFAEFAKQHKLHYYAGTLNAFTADHPVDPQQLREFRIGDLGTAPWRGVVLVGTWIVTADSPAAMVPATLDRPYRIWGKLVATGDEDFLDHIERLYGER
jgi:hypothetical protein